MTAFIRVALAMSASLFLAACGVGDQSCAEAYNPNDLNDHCPYGPPGGPKQNQGGPEDPCPQIAAKTGCGVDFNEVFARFEAKESGNCTNQGAGCHTAVQKGISGWTDAAEMLAALEVYSGELGRPYFNRPDPTKSWVVCNIRGDVGSPMPAGKSPMSDADIALVEEWLACAAPGDLEGPAGGQGGAGGGI